jgi:hypothetical protein
MVSAAHNAGMPARRRPLPSALDAEHELLIRLSDPDDGAVLARLAALDSQAPLQDGALIAKVDGVAVAALSLRDGRLTADPFAHTAAVGDLLRLRAASIAASKRTPTPFGRLLRLALAG